MHHRINKKLKNQLALVFNHGLELCVRLTDLVIAICL